MKIENIKAKIEEEFSDLFDAGSEIFAESVLSQIPLELEDKHLTHMGGGCMAYVVNLKCNPHDYQLVVTDISGCNLPSEGDWMAFITEFSSEQPVLFVEDASMALSEEEKNEDLLEAQYQHAAVVH